MVSLYDHDTHFRTWLLLLLRLFAGNARNVIEQWSYDSSSKSDVYYLLHAEPRGCSFCECSLICVNSSSLETCIICNILRTWHQYVMCVTVPRISFHSLVAYTFFFTQNIALTARKDTWISSFNIRIPHIHMDWGVWTIWRPRHWNGNILHQLRSLCFCPSYFPTHRTNMPQLFESYFHGHFLSWESIDFTIKSHYPKSCTTYNTNPLSIYRLFLNLLVFYVYRNTRNHFRPSWNMSPPDKLCEQWNERIKPCNIS